MEQQLADYRNRLKELQGKIKELHQFQGCSRLTDVTPNNAPQYLEWSSRGYGAASLYYSMAIELYNKIDTLLDTARSIAFLDKAKVALAGEKKDTAAARNQYVSRDEDVISALDMRSEAEALMAFLKNKAQEYRMNHEATKKIAYGDNFGVGDHG